MRKPKTHTVRFYEVPNIAPELGNKTYYYSNLEDARAAAQVLANDTNMAVPIWKCVAGLDRKSVLALANGDRDWCKERVKVDTIKQMPSLQYA
jgi:hypothetical protein